VTAAPSVNLAGGEVTAFFLVLMRCTGFVVTAPLFGHRVLPRTVKAALAIGFGASLFPRASVAPGAYAVALAAPVELLMGLTLGFLLSLGFHAVELGGRLLALQLGLSLEAVLNPLNPDPSTALDPFFAVLAGILFLALDLHVATVRILAGSLTAFPIGGGWPIDLGLVGGQLIVLALELAVRIALPLALALLLVELLVGLMARALPQINVFLVGLPAKVLIGTAALAVAMPTLVAGAARIFETIFRAVARTAT
jgi:flagellar biosynthetic protein FliR